MIQQPKPHIPKVTLWAKVNKESLRLTGEHKFVKQQETSNLDNDWVQLDRSVAVMLTNNTKPWNLFAKLGAQVIEVPEDIDLNFLTHVSPDAWPEILTIDHKWTGISWTPLDVPKIEPDNWDLFWELWNAKHKVVGRPDIEGQNYWEGLCIWLHPNIDPNTFNYSGTAIDDWSKHFPKMFEQIKNSMPFTYIEKIVLWKNVKEVHAHFDPDKVVYPFPDSLRVMLWDTNTEPTFYMTKWPARSETYNPTPVTERKGSRGYGIKPLVPPLEQRRYVKLPEDTNTFLFNNGAFIHGADFAQPKIIMAIKGNPDIYKWLKSLESSYNKYKDIIYNAKI
jgi:hypothetical protein